MQSRKHELLCIIAANSRFIETGMLALRGGWDTFPKWGRKIRWSCPLALLGIRQVDVLVKINSNVTFGQLTG